MVSGARFALSFVEIFSHPRCPVCGVDGYPLHADCFERLVEGGLEDGLLWYWSYDGRSAQIIKDRKSKLDMSFFYWAGFFMGKLAPRFGLSPPEFVTYVPHHPTEMRIPFSVPFVLALGMSDALAAKLLHAIKKRRRTAKQKFLDRKARRENVEGAFEFIGDSGHWGEMWIIDDIYTTGATLNEVARVAKTAGVEKVLLVTLARTPRIF